jgi:hypothetical protein
MSKHAVPDVDLRIALQHSLAEHFGAARSIVRLERRPSRYQSSFALEELDVDLHDGVRLHLLFKSLGAHAMLDDARAAKPGFLYNPGREAEIYRTVLASAGLGTAVCYGAVLDPDSERYWLFLERVSGQELYEIGDLATWRDVARWLAGFHTRFASKSKDAFTNVLHYDSSFYGLWMQRAQINNPALRRLAQVYPRVIERLLTLPTTLIHGEFYASNVLVEQTAGSARVCPVDWEMAAIGPGLMDLAALTAGKWTDETRTSIAHAYHEALPEPAVSPVEFLETLDYCRLHQAVQWLGWSADWAPPTAHAQDWCEIALGLADKLQLLKGERSE